MSSKRFRRMITWLVAMVLIIACASSVYIPFSGARWNEILRIDSELADWLQFLPLGGESNCTQPRLYWLANPSVWPSNNLVLAGLPLSKEEALQLLQLTPENRALDILTAELITTYLNKAHGADPTLVNSLINEAEATIILSGVPEGRQYVQDERTLLLAQNLADYNEGRLGPGICPEPTPTETRVPSPTPLSCSFTLAYWTDHPEAWAIQEVRAGVLYTQPAALRLLRNESGDTDLAAMLTRQLIGARLSLAAGLPLGDWIPAMELSDDWLKQHPIGAGINPEMESGGRVLLTLLEKVNQGEIGFSLCPQAQVTPSPTPSSTATPTSSRPPLDCTFPLTYWVDHPEAWIVQELQAGELYNQQEAINILLFGGTNPDLAIMLTRQLIVARLNLAAGVQLDDWLSAVEFSESWLQENPIGSKINPDTENGGRILLMLLEKFNNGESGIGLCPEAQLSPSPTASLSPTSTPTFAFTLTPATTPSPSITPIVTYTPGVEITPIKIRTLVPSPTLIPSSTPLPTMETSPTPSASVQPSATPDATSQPYPSITPTPTEISEPLPSLTPTPTVTDSLSPSPTFTPELSSTDTPTVSDTPSPSPTFTPELSSTDTPPETEIPNPSQIPIP